MRDTRLKARQLLGFSDTDIVADGSEERLGMGLKNELATWSRRLISSAPWENPTVGPPPLFLVRTERIELAGFFICRTLVCGRKGNL